ncbi:hypothetical protein ACFS5M_13895 [Lacinutrix iliipiscaria]|uniref:STAS/SEC14 domain-containing protein n=1 Tax=Lacinutrix iliipiscaria TaxID=1230532 RepID=A0ABW5WU96_9FLAO
MKFEESALSNQYPFTKITLDFGEFYLFEKFVIAEMNYGIHLSWSKIKEAIKVILLHYGENYKIGYISNKTNSYSFEPNLWSKFFENYDFIIASATVYYSDLNYINATLEKQFSSKSVKRADSLEEAVSWILNLDEFKE